MFICEDLTNSFHVAVRLFSNGEFKLHVYGNQQTSDSS